MVCSRLANSDEEFPVAIHFHVVGALDVHFRLWHHTPFSAYTYPVGGYMYPGCLPFANNLFPNLQVCVYVCVYTCV